MALGARFPDAPPRDAPRGRLRKLLLALVLVATAASVTVPRLGDDDDLVLAVPEGADPGDVVATLTARLELAGLPEVDVAEERGRLALSPVDGDTRPLLEALAGAYQLNVRPVEGECESAEQPETARPDEPVDLPVRPPHSPSCLRLGPSVGGNDAVRRAQASGTEVVIEFAELPLEAQREWAVEVDGEVLASPRLGHGREGGVEMVIDARSRQSALVLAAGIVHPLPADLRA